jgi:membrane-associated phospholipid phosphatase
MRSVVVPDAPSRGVVTRSDLVKVAATLVVFAYWTLGYKLTNEWCATSERAIRLARPYDVYPGLIQPWTAIIYIFGGFSIPFIPFLYNWTWSKLSLVLRAYFFCSTISFIIYAVVPMIITRPPYEGGAIGAKLMRWIVSVDNEANCCPSSHTYFAVLAAILVGHGNAPRWVQVSVWALAVAICISTITTGQHYLIDVPGGVVTAVASYYAARWAGSRRAEATRRPATADGAHG